MIYLRLAAGVPPPGRTAARGENTPLVTELHPLHRQSDSQQKAMTIKTEYSLSSAQRQVVTCGSVHGDFYSEFFLTCDLTDATSQFDFVRKYELLIQTFIDSEITPVYEKAFGKLSYYHPFVNSRSDIHRSFGLSPERIPFTYIQGAPANKDARWAGVHLYGIRVHEPSNVNIKDISDNSDCIGKIIDFRNGRQAYFTGLTGKDRNISGPLDAECETTNVFANLEQMLQNAGFQSSELVRTWFHLRDVLADYDAFNNARKESFAGKVHGNCLPASTAIQGEPAFGRSISLDALAIRSLSASGPIVRTMTSPRQPEAKTYGPLFSRGMEITWPRYKVLHVSGTASIDENGRSVHIDDPAAQVRNTLRIIESLLKKYGATMNDIVQANAYFKSRETEPIFSDVLRQNEWHSMPCLRLIGDICRHDLLFEMDCIAVVQL